MSTISAQAQRILDILIRRLPQIVPGEPQTYIGYKEIHDDLELSMAGQTYGDSLKHQGLEELAMWTVANELPAITGLIVDRTTFMPGDGYFRAFGRPTDDFGWWAKEVVKSKQFAWTPYSSAIVPPAPPIASDILQPPRIETTTFRILRDTALARRIKLLHNFQCQVCGATIILRDGTRYAEAHHVRPLGAPHNGPDVGSNILCLCPNHHAEFDFGVRALTLAELRKATGHAVDEEYAKYHNEVIRALPSGLP